MCDKNTDGEDSFGTSTFVGWMRLTEKRKETLCLHWRKCPNLS